MPRVFFAVVLLVVFLALPAGAQMVSTTWAVFTALDPSAGPPQMMLLGPYPNRFSCLGALPELRSGITPEAIRAMRVDCRSALDLARMLLAP